MAFLLRQKRALTTEGTGAHRGSLGKGFHYGPQLRENC